MINYEGTYYVCSRDIQKSALDCARRMGVGGWRRQAISDMLKEYATVMDEIADNANIPWNKLSEWRKDADYLRSKECLNVVMLGIRNAIDSIKHLSE